jgi:hypothetical protein
MKHNGAMANQHVEKYQNIPPSKVERGGHEAKNVLHPAATRQFSNHIQVVLNDKKKQVVEKSYWALVEFECIIQHIHSNVKSTLRAKKALTEYNRLIGTMFKHLDVSTSNYDDLGRVQALINEMTYSRNQQAIASFEMNQTLNRTEEKFSHPCSNAYAGISKQ